MRSTSRKNRTKQSRTGWGGEKRHGTKRRSPGWPDRGRGGGCSGSAPRSRRRQCGGSRRSPPRPAAPAASRPPPPRPRRAPASASALRKRPRRRRHQHAPGCSERPHRRSKTLASGRAKKLQAATAKPPNPAETPNCGPTVPSKPVLASPPLPPSFAAAYGSIRRTPVARRSEAKLGHASTQSSRSQQEFSLSLSPRCCSAAGARCCSCCCLLPRGCFLATPHLPPSPLPSRPPVPYAVASRRGLLRERDGDGDGVVVGFLFLPFGAGAERSGGEPVPATARGQRASGTGGGRVDRLAARPQRGVRPRRGGAARVGGRLAGWLARSL